MTAALTAGMTDMVAVESLWADTREAEHGFEEVVAARGAQVVTAATHFVVGTRSVAVTAQLAGHRIGMFGTTDPDTADRLRTLHRRREGGRVFRFPGSGTLVGALAVGQVLAGTAIDEIVMIGHRERVADDVTLDTQSFVRPAFTDGHLQLVVRPAVDGRVIPFEQPDPTPCCGQH